MSEPRLRKLPTAREHQEGVPQSEKGATCRYDVDPSTGRKVPHKRINNAYLVHQRWLQKQELIKERKRARAEGKHVPYDPDLDDEDERSFAANLILSVFYTAFLAMVIAIFGGLFIHGDALWGYRGKWTNWRTYFPVRTKPYLQQPPMQEFTPEQLSKFKGYSNTPVYVSTIDATKTLSLLSRVMCLM